MRISIANKLSLAIVAILVSITAILGWLIAGQQSALLEQEMHKYALGTTQLLTRQIKEPLLSQDELTLEQIINSAMGQEAVVGIEVHRVDVGSVIARGVNPVNRRALLGQPLHWIDADQQRYLSYLQAALIDELKVGEVVVTFNANVLREVKDQAANFVVYTSVVLVAVGILIAVFMSAVVTSPILKLIQVSRRIAAGDYQARFSRRRNDELGILIESLNVMTEKLVHKIHLERTLSQYVSPKIANEVLNTMEPQELGGREVEASVVFADIVGFTSLTEHMPAVAVSQLLNEYFTVIDQVVFQCDGHVDKYMGDCAMLVFGVPEDDASEHQQRAMYCALLIQRIIEHINQERGALGKVTVSFSIGVNSGIMLAGNMGSRARMEYTVLGDAVNTASRLASVAKAQEVLITQALAQSSVVAEHYECRSRDRITLKGKSDPIRLYTVIRGDEEIEERLERDIGVVLANVESGEPIQS